MPTRWRCNVRQDLSPGVNNEGGWESKTQFKDFGGSIGICLRPLYGSLRISANVALRKFTINGKAADLGVTDNCQQRRYARVQDRITKTS